MPEISIIIPSYNKEAYLTQCLDSILTQSFQDFEIILYDDASSDRSREICAAYAERYPHIKYFQHIANCGQQATIKDGVAQAKGNWIAFVDSDDTLPKDALSTLYSLCSEKTDIIVGFSWQGDDSIKQVPIKEWRIWMLQSDPILCTRWAKLYRKSLLDEETMSGLSSIKLGEDMIQNIKIAFRSQKPVTVVYKQVYCYNRNEGSYSVGYNWTADKTSILYEAVRRTLPDDTKTEYLHAIVFNGLGMLEKSILKCSKLERNRLKNSVFIDQLQKDATSWKYPLKRYEKMMLKTPTSILIHAFLLSRRSCKILNQYIKRNVLKK